MNPVSKDVDFPRRQSRAFGRHPFTGVGIGQDTAEQGTAVRFSGNNRGPAVAARYESFARVESKAAVFLSVGGISVGGISAVAGKAATRQ
jgi:hypothetical protein